MTNSSVIKNMVVEYLRKFTVRSKRSDISVTSQFGAVSRRPTQVLLYSHINQELMMLHWHSEDNQLPSVFLNISPRLCLSVLALRSPQLEHDRLSVKKWFKLIRCVCNDRNKLITSRAPFVPSQLGLALLLIPSSLSFYLFSLLFDDIFEVF